MRYLGLDLGSKTLGISISDETGIIASSYTVLRYTEYNALINELVCIIDENNIGALVLGNPLNLNGSMSKRSEETIEFMHMLEKHIKIPIHLQDERFSTTEAENLLIKNKMSRKKRKKIVDKIAATLILQTYLDRK